MTSTRSHESTDPAGDHGRASPERFAPVADGVDLCYQTFGDPADEPMLLVMGLGGPMNWWDPALCRLLAACGYFVIRYDNRDTGRSSRIRVKVSQQTVVRAYAGLRVRAPYSLADLAADGFGLLDHLGLSRAHLVGVSMGGMIVQTMALSRPDRAASLTSIMSTTGRRSVGWQDPRLLPLTLQRRTTSRQAYVDTSTRVWRLIGSPGYPETVETTRERAGETWDRGVSAGGTARQVLAILTQPDRTRALRELTMPSLVIHGLADKMVHVSGGRSTAHALPGAELLLVPGMGHDLPEPLYATFADAITRTARRAVPVSE